MGHAWNWWWVMPLALFVVLAGLLAVVIALTRDGPSSLPAGLDPTAEAERILDDRYARGELDDDEFRHRRAVLRESTRPSS